MSNKQNDIIEENETLQEEAERIKNEIAYEEETISQKELVENDLRGALRNSRKQESYLSLDEIVKIIQEVFYKQDLEILSKKLLEQ